MGRQAAVYRREYCQRQLWAGPRKKARGTRQPHAAPVGCRVGQAMGQKGEMGHARGAAMLRLHHTKEL